jgi:hypothetical protein
MELLFDLDKDPSEKRNLAFQHREEIMASRMAMAEWESKLPPVRP